MALVLGVKEFVGLIAPNGTVKEYLSRTPPSAQVVVGLVISSRSHDAALMGCFLVAAPPRNL
jgi:hypothetical protein